MKLVLMALPSQHIPAAQARSRSCLGSESSKLIILTAGITSMPIIGFLCFSRVTILGKGHCLGPAMIYH